MAERGEEVLGGLYVEKRRRRGFEADLYLSAEMSNFFLLSVM